MIPLPFSRFFLLLPVLPQAGENLNQVGSAVCSFLLLQKNGSFLIAVAGRLPPVPGPVPPSGLCEDSQSTGPRPETREDARPARAPGLALKKRSLNDCQPAASAPRPPTRAPAPGRHHLPGGGVGGLEPECARVRRGVRPAAAAHCPAAPSQRV